MKNDHTEHEKKIAQLLEDKVGGEIFLVPKVEYPQGIKTPDYIFNGVEYDLKCITSNKKNAIYNLVHKKKGQSKNFIFDFSSSILTIDEINEQINYVFTNQHTSFVDEIVVINNGEIALIVRRNTQ